MIISIDREKLIDKIQHLFHKNKKQTKHKAYSMKALLLKPRTRQRFPLSPLVLNIGLEVLTRKEGTQIGREVIKPSLCYR